MTRAACLSALMVVLALAGCNSASVLDPSPLQPVTPEVPAAAATPASPPPPTAGAAPAQPAAPAQVAALPAGTARVHFAPVVGATEIAANPLAQRLATRASERGIGLAPADASGTTHVLKGYFSAITEGSATTVIYVWDVLDPAGNRVHRIQGQQRATGGSGEGWNAVTPAAMEAIADRTVDDLTSWLASRAG